MSDVRVATDSLAEYARLALSRWRTPRPQGCRGRVGYDERNRVHGAGDRYVQAEGQLVGERRFPLVRNCVIGAVG